MKLHQLTIEALKHKAEVAAETYDPTDEETAWAKVADEQCRAVAAAGTTEALSQNPKAQDELENYLGGDMPPRETTAIVSDLCRSGYYWCGHECGRNAVRRT
jgi:hypothetical protein